MTAEEAAARLGVKRATLYAYVSRGLLRSRSTPGGRARLYLRADVEALRERGRGAPAAAGALRWGEPVLDSGITAMAPEGPVYRGHWAVDLARRGVAFESVAELLWTGALPETTPTWEPGDAPDWRALARMLPADAAPSLVAPLVLAAAGARDPGRFDVRPEAVLPRACRLIRLLAAGLALPAHPERALRAWQARRIADAVAVACGVKPSRRTGAALDRFLVLIADHELNASTFAARIAASTRADVYAAVAAGLATLSGPWHGAVSDQVEAVVAEIGQPENALRIVRERDRRGERVPGFGHGFYRGPDPRAEVLIETVLELGARNRSVKTVQALISAMELSGKPGANVDAGVVALRAALGLPRGSAAGLFAVGRTAGWVAHVLEQYASGQLLRPRARYSGPPPSPRPA